MADNNQQQNNNQQNNGKQKGGGGNGPVAGISLFNSFSYTEGTSFGSTVKKAAIEGGGYVVGVAAAACFAKLFNIIVSAFTGAPKQPIFYAPRQQGNNNAAQSGQNAPAIEAAPAVHPMAYANDLVKNDPAMAKRVADLISKRTAETTVQEAPVEAAPAVEETPLMIITPVEIPVPEPEAPANNGNGQQNNKKNKHNK